MLADTLRKTRTQTVANRLSASGQAELVPAASLRKNDVVMVKAGEFIPSDGEIVEGVASVDESAITGESAPVIREAGGDRSAVTGGTKVLSDWLKVRVTADPGHTFLDRMIALVEGAERQKTPNEIALNILLAGLTAVPVEVIEAAKIDGAGPLRRFVYVVAPIVRPILFVGFLYSIVFSFTDFSAVWLLTQGGPYNTTHVFGTYAYNVGINAGDIGQGAAIAIHEIGSGRQDVDVGPTCEPRELLGKPLWR